MSWPGTLAFHKSNLFLPFQVLGDILCCLKVRPGSTMPKESLGGKGRHLCPHDSWEPSILCKCPFQCSMLPHSTFLRTSNQLLLWTLGISQNKNGRILEFQSFRGLEGYQVQFPQTRKLWVTFPWPHCRVPTRQQPLCLPISISHLPHDSRHS